MHIGLIGGIGVAATVLYYQRLTAMADQRDMPLNLTIAHADIQTLIRNARTDDRGAQADVFAEMSDQLKAGGASCVALTSLGAHFCAQEFAQRSALPVISGVAPLDDHFAQQGFARVGLLGTPVVMRSHLYGQLHKTQAVTLEDEIETLGQTYIDMAVAGRCDAQQRQQLLDAGARMVHEHDAQAIVLAGTDLNLAFDNQNTDYNVIDAVDVHVAQLAELAAGTCRLEDVAMER